MGYEQHAAARGAKASGRQGDFALIAGIGLGAVILYGFGVFDYRERVISSNDFSGLWAGARVILVGGDPYDPGSWERTVATLGTQRPDTVVFGYPPWVAVSLLPLALLPLPVASGVWVAVGLALAVVTLRSLLRTFVAELPLVHWVSGLALLASQPGLATFFSGQWTYLLLAASTGVFQSLASRRPGRAGLLAIAVVFKPQLFAFALWSWLEDARARRMLARFASVALGGVAAATFGLLIARPEWIAQWSVHVVAQRVSDPTTPTLLASLNDVVGPLGPVAAVVVLLVALYFALRTRPATAGWWSIWMVLSLLTATYTRSYDQLLLLPPLIVTTGRMLGESRRRAVRFAALWGALLIPGSLALQGLAAARGREDFTIALTAAIFVLVALVPSSRDPR